MGVRRLWGGAWSLVRMQQVLDRSDLDHFIQALLFSTDTITRWRGHPTTAHENHQSGGNHPEPVDLNTVSLGFRAVCCSESSLVVVSSPSFLPSQHASPHASPWNCYIVVTGPVGLTLVRIPRLATRPFTVYELDPSGERRYERGKRPDPFTPGWGLTVVRPSRRFA